MKKNVAEIIISKNAWLGEALKQIPPYKKEIPSNSFIHKGRCGIGGTTLEIDTERHSIIIVPTQGIIKGKISSEPKRKNRNPNNRLIFGIYKGIPDLSIKNELSSSDKFIKIMVTPDSFNRIIAIANSFNMTEWLYRNFFVLCDESHTSVTEKFRERILEPFKWLWDFDNKAFISATPFYFSEPRIQKLNHYEIKFEEPYLEDITVIETSTIKSCINTFLNKSNDFPGNLHFFYNSVKEIAEIVRYSGIKDCNIYCADKTGNMERLDVDQVVFFNPEPKKGGYKKINFYTSRYFEGIDIEDKNATIVLVTDVNVLFTKVGIRNKGVQAVGRLRKKPHKLYHITNHRDKPFREPLAYFNGKYFFHAKQLISNYNRYVRSCSANDYQPLEEEKERIQNFSDLNEDLSAELNHTKVDQFINEDYCNEEFNDLSFIIEAWEDSGYKVNVIEFSEPLRDTPSQIRRKSRKTIMKETVELIDNLEKSRDKSFLGFNEADLEKIKTEHPLAFEAYYTLGMEKIKELDYNETAIKNELKRIHHLKAEEQLTKLVIPEFKVGETYPRKYIKTKLQELYNLVELEETAKAPDLRTKGWFILEEVGNLFLIKEMTPELKSVAELLMRDNQ